MSSYFKNRLERLIAKYNEIITRKNEPLPSGNGIYERFRYPVLTRDHIPLTWKYDLNKETNPWLMERLGVNSVFNPGAVELDGKIYLIARVEGYDRKSFFAVAESENGIDNFRFRTIPSSCPRPTIRMSMYMI